MLILRYIVLKYPILKHSEPIQNLAKARIAALNIASKYSDTACTLRFFGLFCVALHPLLEILNRLYSAALARPFICIICSPGRLARRISHYCILVFVLYVAVACDKLNPEQKPPPPPKTMATDVNPCAKGMSQQNITELVEKLRLYRLDNPQIESHLRRKLGLPNLTGSAPDCYPAPFTEVLKLGLKTEAVALFNSAPFDHTADANRYIQVYERLILDLAKITGEEWRISGLSVNYLVVDEQIVIEFQSFGKTFRWYVDQHEAINRIGEEFFELLNHVAVHLTGSFMDLSKAGEGAYAYVPKKLAEELKRMELRG